MVLLFIGNNYYEGERNTLLACRRDSETKGALFALIYRTLQFYLYLRAKKPPAFGC